MTINIIVMIITLVSSCKLFLDLKLQKEKKIVRSHSAEDLSEVPLSGTRPALHGASGRTLAACLVRGTGWCLIQTPRLTLSVIVY